MSVERYIKAQKDSFKVALSEIKNGQKSSHWMWFIFPQISGLGFSDMAEFYAIKDIDEAKEYINNDFLKENLIEISSELLKLNTDNALQVFGYPDNLKLKSCMTLFLIAEPKCIIFQKVLDKFFDGKKDELTLKILNIKR